MKFIKLKDQVVNADTIIKVDSPRKTAGIEWYIRTLFDTTKTEEIAVNSLYNTEEEAKSDYNRIVEQLCSEKN